MERVSVRDYFEQAESLRPMELVYGVVREPPAPRYGHQSIVTRLTVLLDTHVRAHGLGVVCVAPVDVVLDEQGALVLQPDVVFVAQARLGIIRDRIWGPPDLVVEVLSTKTEQRDRVMKMQWYRLYGVGECWLVDPKRQSLEVVPFGGSGQRATTSGDAVAVSTVLTGWDVPTSHIFT
jgi:Uma2 family endonuclease